MQKYTEHALEKKINKFLVKKTQKFPDLEWVNSKQAKRKDIEESLFRAHMQEVRRSWMKYIYA